MVVRPLSYAKDHILKMFTREPDLYGVEHAFA
jgi:hypothetical protein